LDFVHSGVIVLATIDNSELHRIQDMSRYKDLPMILPTLRSSILARGEPYRPVFTPTRNDATIMYHVRRFHILPSRGPDALYAIFNCRMTTTREISLGSLASAQ